MSDDRHRLFVGIRLPSDLRDEVGDRLRKVRRRLPRARWVRPELLHVTLRFLGDTEGDLIPAVREVLDRTCAAHSAGTYRLVDAGTFPPSRPARVAWIGIDAPDSLRPLQAELAGGLDELLGLEPEGRPFHPHVTVARCRPPWPRRPTERFAAELAGPWGDPFPVEDVLLYESILGPEGPSYEVLHRSRLGSPGPQ